ncbi:lipo [Chlorella sorokiniana]|uniref:Lipo n=1 Tax=Chlorella sorokiniana TaxID=3076 RepID=A0A2P6TYA1_CHLSO|nr:lipo [Chlorella sorokiniana]|eukprot:PRW59045.1 lipo [Chlorella sorokiniana]
MNRLSAEATEAGLRATLGNINMQQGYTQYNGQDSIPVGTVCHEETLGDYASFVNIQEGTPELGGQLWCDYKMSDTDFLLLPSVAAFFLNTTQGELLDANANLVLQLARPFAADPTIENLISIRPGQSVGDWRDSETGLAFAPIPFDVNVALVPAALRAIEAVAGGEGNLTFYALSLQSNGTKVPVMQSDLSFSLLYGSNLPESLIRAVPALLAEFPAGLLTPAGMVVASPSYAGIEPELESALYQNFTNGFYHGEVVWGFVEAMMVEGLERQLALCDSPSAPTWCSDSQLVSQLRTALDRLWGTIVNNADVAFSEVWSWKYENGGYRTASLAETSATSTESNAVQLWSHAFIAVPGPTGGTLLEL